VRYFGRPFKGKTTSPAFIPIIVEAIAETKDTRKEEVALQIYKNFTRFFNIEV
jgi:Tat protein secretion system quality control protein TatD with DNase activity